MQYTGNAQDTGGYHKYSGDIMSTMGVFSTLGNIMSYTGGYLITVGKVIEKTTEFVWKPQSTEHMISWQEHQAYGKFQFTFYKWRVYK